MCLHVPRFRTKKTLCNKKYIKQKPTKNSVLCLKCVVIHAMLDKNFMEVFDDFYSKTNTRLTFRH